MAQKRLSMSSARSVVARSPSPFSRGEGGGFGPPSKEAEEWVKAWQGVFAKDLIDSPVVTVNADTSVEEACDLLLSKDILCLAIKSNSPESDSQSDSDSESTISGLFDFADVNAFLTLAATRHTFHPDYLRENPRIEKIVAAAKAGRVPVHLVSNLSEKNPLAVLPHDATLISLLGIFSRGTHRVLIQSPPPSSGYLGSVSDGRLLEYFFSYAQQQQNQAQPSRSYSQPSPSIITSTSSQNPPTSASQPQPTSSTTTSKPLPATTSSPTPSPTFHTFLQTPLHILSPSLPSLTLFSAVISCSSSSKVLDAMKLMSECGVSSCAVLDEGEGRLLSAVSVTDIGRIVVPAQSNQILSTPLHQLIAHIKEPLGSTDGIERYPVYSVSTNSTLIYAMEKLLATSTHRLFITSDSAGSSSTNLAAKGTNLTGIISIVDILSLFARVANVPNVDPTRMQRHRRASSVSSQGSMSSGEFIPNSPLSRSSSLNRSPRSGGRRDSLRNSVGSLDGGFKWADRVPIP
ncbi:hypothetical protein JAAARDRAFT_46832 [Jaapia argillacea MUCL 33604]|uniref:CBS domain-containing protein n=1 Tax=Jaapia argillacea MUCL 33604 TaxID=933084 RepID=A0A067PWU0_9AGAM|nr:hypothetical protein JAAARDRAFT_46832 [Jaapia argillacea MUCL 33604]